ncbi:MAG: hypothetical protein K0V04_29075 [Deltaproteobacteria bacterium]|nr:hypothetical protein [Deltaproteobacteria bacterium]
MTLHDAVRTEIEALHEFFVGWFSGALDRNAEVFADGFQRRFCDDFLLVPPAGTRLAVADLGGGVERAHGSNREFRIAIRAVEIQLQTPTVVVATYEEWQRNAMASTPPDNGRIATVVFERAAADSMALRWRLVHETWLPAEVMAAGDYDF